MSFSTEQIDNWLRDFENEGPVVIGLARKRLAELEAELADAKLRRLDLSIARDMGEAVRNCLASAAFMQETNLLLEAMNDTFSSELQRLKAFVADVSIFLDETIERGLFDMDLARSFRDVSKTL